MARKLVILLAAAVCICAPGCQKIEEEAQLETNLSFVMAGSTDAVPMNYGQLVSVTPVVNNPYQALLWFRAPDESVVAVRVNVTTGGMSKRILSIPRN